MVFVPLISALSRAIFGASSSSPAMAATDPQYPGYSHPSSTASFPLGSHPEEIETVSELLPVREVAMLSVMERLTDKPEWHRKVFDDEIVSKWKAEALAVADETWMEIAATPSSKWIVKSPREPEPSVEGWDILDETAFDYVSSNAQYNQGRNADSTSATSASKSCVTRRRILKRQA